MKTIEDKFKDLIINNQEYLDFLIEDFRKATRYAEYKDLAIFTYGSLKESIEAWEKYNNN